MNRLHCDICDHLLGIHDPTHQKSIWNTLETQNIKLDYCREHNELVEKVVKEAIHELVEQLNPQMRVIDSTRRKRS